MIIARKIALLALFAPTFALAQGSQLPKYTVATLPAASTLPKYIVQVIDGTSVSDCTTGGGSYNVLCTPQAGVWTSLSSIAQGGTINGNLNVTGTVAAGASYLMGASPFGPITVTVQPGETVCAAIARLPSTGGVVSVPKGTFRSGCENPTPGSAQPWTFAMQEANVDIEGAGMPTYAPDFSSFVAGTGTIIQGSFFVQADNFTMRNLGVDVGTTFVAANYAGQPDNGLVLTNIGLVAGKSPQKNPRIEHVATLLASPSAPFHAMLIENVTGAVVNDVQTYGGVWGVVLKGDHSSVSNTYSRGHNQACTNNKSDNYGVSNNNTLANIKCASVTANDTGGIYIESATAMMSDIALSNATLYGTNFGVQLLSDTGGISGLARVSISNVNIDYGTTASTNYCLGSSGGAPINEVVFNNIACSLYAQGLYFTNPMAGSSISNFTGYGLTNGNTVNSYATPLNIIGFHNQGATTGQQWFSNVTGSVTNLYNYECAGCTSTLTTLLNGAIVNLAPRASDLNVNSTGVLGGARMYGTNATYLQGSDGTGTNQHCAKFNAGGILTDSGAPCRPSPIFGVATLVSGTATVSNASACTPSSTCVYMLTNCWKNSSTGIGTLEVGVTSPGISFTINSLSPTNTVLTTDASIVCWVIYD